jgi:hypothetical protein
MTMNSEKKASVMDVIKGTIILVIIVFFVQAYQSDSRRNNELAETKDLARIAFLLLDYVEDEAKSSVKVEKDIIHIEFRLDPWHLTNSSVQSQFLKAMTREKMP